MAPQNSPFILIRGAGDLASGVALRLFRSGFGVVMTEVNQPLSVRRRASFSEAVFDGQAVVEGVQALRVQTDSETLQTLKAGKIAVRIDPEAECLHSLPFLAVVDARMLKSTMPAISRLEVFTVGLGPGFTGGENCAAAVETNRGPNLGRVLWQGSTQPDTTEPESVLGKRDERVIRAPAAGTLLTRREIADLVAPGALIAEIDGVPIEAPFKAIIRGLLRDHTRVERGQKLGDLDPRCDPELCFKASDKALAMGGGVLEALLSNPSIRRALGEAG